jgi:hypothetical protein
MSVATSSERSISSVVEEATIRETGVYKTSVADAQGRAESVFLACNSCIYPAPRVLLGQATHLGRTSFHQGRSP